MPECDMSKSLATYMAKGLLERGSSPMPKMMRTGRWKRAREEGEKLLCFATWAGVPPEKMKLLSFIAEYSGPRTLGRLKRQIQDGEMEDVFSTSKISRKEGDFAENASEYLGARRVRKCVREALKSDPFYAGNEAAEYLCWAAMHGKGEVKAGAAAGLASICAKAAKEKQGYSAKIRFLATDGHMKTLKRALGEGNAEYLVEECAGGVRMGKPSLIGFWGAVGALAASGIEMLGGMAQRGIFDVKAAVVMGISAALAFACIELSKATGLRRLEGRIARLLDGNAKQESFKNPIS